MVKRTSLPRRSEFGASPPYQVTPIEGTCCSFLASVGPRTHTLLKKEEIAPYKQ